MSASVLFGMAALAIVSTGCASAAVRDLRGMPRCDLVGVAAPADWKQIEFRDGFTVRLPECFSEVTEKPLWPHGGDRWRCGAAEVDIVWGHWGLDSFADHGHRCRGRLGGMPVLFDRSDRSKDAVAAAWYFTAGIYDPYVHASSTDPRDAPMLLAIVSSGRR